MKQTVTLLFVFIFNLRGIGFDADSRRGEQLFQSLHCIECHSVGGKGGSSAPDLGRIVDREFTPASLAATMWNHAPTMWASMRQRGIARASLDAAAARDLFAFFYAARFFEKPGDAGRGKRVFTDRGCAACHGLSVSSQPGIRPIRQWDAVADPIALTEAMWNHAPRMLAETQSRHVRWPNLSAQDLTDVLVYLRHSPSPPVRPPEFRIGDGSDGEAVFRARKCSQCHLSAVAMASSIRGQSLTAIAAAMWNHEPIMAKAGATPFRFETGEMRELLGYIWADQFFADTGSAKAGRRVFAQHRCGACHGSSAPPLLKSGKSFTGSSMVSALWLHGPSMLEQMKAQGVVWPRFEGTQMADLIAYLNSENKP